MHQKGPMNGVRIGVQKKENLQPEPKEWVRVSKVWRKRGGSRGEESSKGLWSDRRHGITKKMEKVGMVDMDSDARDRWLDSPAGTRSRRALQAVLKMSESLEFILKTLGSHWEFISCHGETELKMSKRETKETGQEATESLPRKDDLD